MTISVDMITAHSPDVSLQELTETQCKTSVDSYRFRQQNKTWSNCWQMPQHPLLFIAYWVENKPFLLPLLQPLQ